MGCRSPKATSWDSSTAPSGSPRTAPLRRCCSWRWSMQQNWNWRPCSTAPVSVTTRPGKRWPSWKRPCRIWRLSCTRAHPTRTRSCWWWSEALQLRLQPTGATDDCVVHCSLPDRKSTRLNSSHVAISYAVFSLKKKRMMSEVDPLIKLQLIKQEHKDWNITDVKKATKSLYDGKRTRKSLQRCQHERHKINIARE